jgi:hypothetical protein
MCVTFEVAISGTNKVEVKTVELLPDVKELAKDPEWEAIEVKISAHCCQNLPPPEPD